MVDNGRLCNVNLVAFKHRWDGNHQGKFLGITLIIIRHRDDGFVVMPCDGDFRGFVEEFGVRLGDVEAAEGVCCGDQGCYANQHETERKYAYQLAESPHTSLLVIPTETEGGRAPCRLRFRSVSQGER